MSCRRPPGFMNAICAAPDSALRRGPLLHLGDQVAQGRLGASVLRRAVGELAAEERTTDLTQRQRTQQRGVRHGVVDDRLGVRVDRVVERTRRSRPSAAAAPACSRPTWSVTLLTSKVSLFSAMPYWPAETTGRSVTGRPAQPGTVNEQSYARWVWPLMIASTLLLTPLMIDPKSDVGSSSIVVQLVLGAPSWTSMHHHVRAIGLELVGRGVDRVDDVGDVDLGDPRRRHQLGQVLGDRTDEPDLDPVHGLRPCLGDQRGLSSLLLRMLAAMYCQFAPPYGLVVAL